MEHSKISCKLSRLQIRVRRYPLYDLAKLLMARYMVKKRNWKKFWIEKIQNKRQNLMLLKAMPVYTTLKS